MTGKYLATFSAIVLSIVIVAIAFFKRRYKYWKQKGVEVCGTPVLPFGNVQNVILQREQLPTHLGKLYDYAKAKGLKYIGYYFIASPIFVPIDRLLIKQILNDSDVFGSRGWYMNEKDDPLSANVVALDGAKWKAVRQKVNQSFTSAQLKFMFQTMAKTAVKLEKLMERFSSGQPLNPIEVISRFATDFTTSSSFGIECNSLEGNDSEFIQDGSIVFKASPQYFLRLMLSLSLSHKLLRFAGTKFWDSNINNLFLKVVDKAVSYRERNNVYKKDFLHLLIEFKNKKKLGNEENVSGKADSPDSLTLKELAAQVFIFYLGGYETTSFTTSFVLHYLSVNQDMEDRVREEITETLDRYDGTLTYDAVSEMIYLHQIVEGKSIFFFCCSFDFKNLFDQYY